MTATPAAVADGLTDSPEIQVPKYALVIGNRDYRPFPKVPTAVNDAVVIANRLHSLNFDVVVRTNATYADIITEIEELKKRVDRVTSENVRPLVVVYFSGHGFVVSGRQFLAAVNTPKSSRDSILGASTAVQKLIDDLAANATLVSYLDACRSDLGITDSVGQRTLDNTAANDDGAKGLGSMRGARNLQPQEYLIAYGNRLGEPVAGFLSRADINNSPYTRILDTYLGDGEDVVGELYLVHEEVQRLVPNHDPGTDVHMNGRVFLEFHPNTLARMRADWADLARSPTAEGMRRFISAYKNGPLAYKALEWLRSSAKH
jgi:hypothetical protein